MIEQTVFIWMGKKPPTAIVVVGGTIKNQSVEQEALADPVKGHLWNIPENKCLVHPVCDCSVLALTTLIYQLGEFPFRNQYIKRQMDQLFNKLIREVPSDYANFQLYLKGKYVGCKPVQIEGEKDGVNGY